MCISFFKVPCVSLKKGQKSPLACLRLPLPRHCLIQGRSMRLCDSPRNNLLRGRGQRHFARREAVCRRSVCKAEKDARGRRARAGADVLLVPFQRPRESGREWTDGQTETQRTDADGRDARARTRTYGAHGYGLRRRGGSGNAVQCLQPREIGIWDLGARKRFTYHVCLCTVRDGRMSPWKWRSTKQHPSRARSGNHISCCLFSLHFLCDILPSRTVHCNPKTDFCC